MKIVDLQSARWKRRFLLWVYLGGVIGEDVFLYLKKKLKF